MSEKKPPIVESMVRDGLSVGAGVIASHDPITGALAGLAIGPVSGAAGRVQQWFGDKFSRRVVQTAGNLGERTEAEGIKPDQEHLEELLENGLPFVGRASREEKRRMMEEILMNGVRSLEDEAKRIEAVEALKLIEALPDGAAIIFASLVKKTEYELTYNNDFYEIIPRCGLSQTVLWESTPYILGSSHEKSKLGLINHLIIHNFHTRKISFTEYGRWLAHWITNNPAPPTE